MTAPLSAGAFLKALVGEGVSLCSDCKGEHWQDHRSPYSSSFGPLRGIVVHHTAGNTTPTSLLRNGNGVVRGPLCHIHVTRDGKAHIVSVRRASHAGMGDKDTLAAMRADREPPRPTNDDIDFNAITYGIEVNGTNDGKPWTDAQIDTVVRICAALCRTKGWTEWNVVGHREITRRKPLDPSGIAMSDLRARIGARLRGADTEPEGKDFWDMFKDKDELADFIQHVVWHRERIKDKRVPAWPISAASVSSYVTSRETLALVRALAAKAGLSDADVEKIGAEVREALAEQDAEGEGAAA